VSPLPPPSNPWGTPDREPFDPPSPRANATAFPTPIEPAPTITVPTLPAAVVPPIVPVPAAPSLPAAPPPALVDAVASSFAFTDEPDQGIDQLDADHEPTAPASPPKKLLATRPWRIASIVANVASFPLTLASAPLGLAASAMSIVALAVWSGTAVTNVGRARPATIHHRPPRPALAALSWFDALVVALPGGALLYRLDEWVDDATSAQQDSRSMIFLAAVAVFAFCLLIAVYQPYRVLGQASRWVSGDSSKFRKWFTAPYLVAVVAGVMLVLASLTLRANAVDDLGGPQTYAAAGLLVFAVPLPWLTWLVCASRAMIDLEEATGHQHRRLTGHGLDVVMPMNPLMAAHAAAQAPVPHI
jgi:hypothetical protein